MYMISVKTTLRRVIHYHMYMPERDALIHCYSFSLEIEYGQRKAVPRLHFHLPTN